MRTDTPVTVYLSQYAPPAWLVDRVALDIRIGDGHTIVGAELALRHNPAGDGGALELDGEDLTLLSIAVDGRALSESEYTLTDAALIIPDLADTCVLTTEVRIEPDRNTQLSGLYRSRDGYFTQCEAEGFRRITYYPDRPDVMARYTCTLHADRARFPVLLANGNCIDHGEEAEGRHWARWEDPFPKPSYLFACVAAKLDVLEEDFITRSGRRVRCAVYVEPGKLDQCGHAMAALKKAMTWDEQRFGLEMDLDHYMIVAVGDFNMGAMENKGLNIFNTRYVLARPDTATDIDYQYIDRVVGHEYFHNWTGNRVTCRDWFQLSLKEGLTVFRDQEFGMDVHSRGLSRIQDVRGLRAGQFPEDAGPMAHPVRPAAYVEINNFYTATVYQKGAEVVRMIHTLIGEAAFRRGMDLYFERHDGQAVTCDEFVAAMEAASGADLSQFRRWYSQAGTPKLLASAAYDASGRRYTLTIEQHYPPTAYERRLESEGQPVVRGPYQLPIAIGLIGPGGEELLPTTVVSLTEDKQSFSFDNIASPPIPSLLRNLSAPVILEYPYSEAELTLLMAHDSDAFNRWEAGQRLASRILLRGISAIGDPRNTCGNRDDADAAWIPPAYIDAVAALLASAFSAEGDPALVAEALILPAETVLAEAMDIVDPDAIHAGRRKLRHHLARHLREPLLDAYRRLSSHAPYVPDGAQAGARALRNQCLSYLAELAPQDPQVLVLMQKQFDSADNMTDSMAALSTLANLDHPTGPAALNAFYEKWKNEPLVVDKWFGVQATSRLPDTVARVRGLLQHPGFDLRNPNKVYSLVRAFCASNPKHFHSADGSGYQLAADVILELDAINPQVTSRIARCFDRWKRYDGSRQALARAQLQRIRTHDGLSADVGEVVDKALDG